MATPLGCKELIVSVVVHAQLSCDYVYLWTSRNWLLLSYCGREPGNVAKLNMLVFLLIVKVPGPKRGEIVRQVGVALREKRTLLGHLVSCG